MKYYEKNILAVILAIVIVLSGAFIAYGADTVLDQREFDEVSDDTFQSAEYGVVFSKNINDQLDFDIFSISVVVTTTSTQDITLQFNESTGAGSDEFCSGAGNEPLDNTQVEPWFASSTNQISTAGTGNAELLTFDNILDGAGFNIADELAEDRCLRINFSDPDAIGGYRINGSTASSSISKPAETHSIDITTNLQQPYIAINSGGELPEGNQRIGFIFPQDEKTTTGDFNSWAVNMGFEAGDVNAKIQYATSTQNLNASSTRFEDFNALAGFSTELSSQSVNFWIGKNKSLESEVIYFARPILINNSEEIFGNTIEFSVGSGSDLDILIDSIGISEQLQAEFGTSTASSSTALFTEWEVIDCSAFSGVSFFTEGTFSAISCYTQLAVQSSIVWLLVPSEQVRASLTTTITGFDSVLPFSLVSGIYDAVKEAVDEVAEKENTITIKAGGEDGIEFDAEILDGDNFVEDFGLDFKEIFHNVIIGVVAVIISGAIIVQSIRFFR